MPTHMPARPHVVIATTAMLSFISFWHAAAVVLNDLGSSAFYVGGISEQAIGESAPWFILVVMLFSYTVRMVYIESSSMFIRGGVYRMVKEAMGGKVAKLSVSALIFDFLLTAPISGVSAGHYLAGLVNDISSLAGYPMHLPRNATAGAFAVLVILYFWRTNVIGIEDLQRESDDDHEDHYCDGSDYDALVRADSAGAWRKRAASTFARQLEVYRRRAWLTSGNPAANHSDDRLPDRFRPFDSGHER